LAILPLQRPAFSFQPPIPISPNKGVEQLMKALMYRGPWDMPAEEMADPRARAGQSGSRCKGGGHLRIRCAWLHRQHRQAHAGDCHGPRIRRGGLSPGRWRTRLRRGRRGGGHPLLLRGHRPGPLPHQPLPQPAHDRHGRARRLRPAGSGAPLPTLPQTGQPELAAGRALRACGSDHAPQPLSHPSIPCRRWRWWALAPSG
jgi:hypothetical protein